MWILDKSNNAMENDAQKKKRWKHTLHWSCKVVIVIFIFHLTSWMDIIYKRVRIKKVFDAYMHWSLARISWKHFYSCRRNLQRLCKIHESSWLSDYRTRRSHRLFFWVVCPVVRWWHCIIEYKLFLKSNLFCYVSKKKRRRI